MILQSDEKISRIDDYIRQIDELVKSFPTFGEYVEQKYSDENIDACMDLLYKLIEDMGAINVNRYNIDFMRDVISFKPSESKYFHLTNVVDKKSKIDMNQIKRADSFVGEIVLEYYNSEKNQDIKPQFTIDYKEVEPDILEKYGLSNTNKTTLPHFDNVTDALAAFFDLDLKRRKGYPKYTEIVPITAF